MPPTELFRILKYKNRFLLWNLIVVKLLHYSNKCLSHSLNHLRFIYMVVIRKRSHHPIKKSQRKELFIRTCGALILEPGNGIRYFGIFSCLVISCSQLIFSQSN